MPFLISQTAHDDVKTLQDDSKLLDDDDGGEIPKSQG